MFSSYWIIELQYKPFMWRRADVRLWRVFVSYFKYKPFMWRHADVRLWHVRLLFSVISPLCGVAPTPDCGIIILAVSSRGVIQTLVWHQHYYSCSFLSRSHSDPRLAPVLLFLQFPLEESFRPSFGTSTTTLQFPLEESFRHSFGTSVTIFAVSSQGVIQTLVWH